MDCFKTCTRTYDDLCGWWWSVDDKQSVAAVIVAVEAVIVAVATVIVAVSSSLMWPAVVVGLMLAASEMS